MRGRRISNSYKLRKDIHPLYILDTQKAAQHPLDLDQRCAIEHLLNLLECPFEPGILHVAGNDANFALRALLLTACIDSSKQPHIELAQQNILSAFKKIARGPVALDAYSITKRSGAPKEAEKSKGQGQTKESEEEKVGCGRGEMRFRDS